MIAEPKRRMILRLVWDRELAATDIAANFNVTFGAISQHLAILRESDFVKVRRDGNKRLYRTDREGLGPLAAVLEEMWRTTLQNLASTIENEEGG